MQIEVDFDVFKALTALRTHEGHTYNNVLRKLLGLGDNVVHRLEASSVSGEPPIASAPTLTMNSGLALKGVFLPDGTLLRAIYKGKLHQAKIENGEWVDQLGRRHTSPSAAARAISGTNINGWRFWQVKRPSDTDWHKLDQLQKSSA